jgi:hypothetical protein
LKVQRSLSTTIRSLPVIFNNYLHFAETRTLFRCYSIADELELHLVNHRHDLEEDREGLFQETCRSEWFLSERFSRLVNFFNFKRFLKARLGFGRFFGFTTYVPSSSSSVTGPPGIMQLNFIFDFGFTF